MIPCFVIGPAKSGTTLMVALLDNHPELTVVPLEVKYYDMYKNVIHSSSDYRRAIDFFLYTSKLKLIQQNRLSTVDPMNTGYQDYSDINFETIKKELDKRCAVYERHPETDRSVLARFIIDFHEAYSAAGGHKIQKGFVVKEGNHGLPYLDLITTDFPNAKFIVLVRDPRDMFASLKSIADLMRQGWMYPSFSSSISVLEYIFSKPRKSCRAYVEFFRDQVSDGQIHFVRYEDLVQDPKSVMQQIGDFLNINFCEQLLTPTAAGKAWGGNASDGNPIVGISRSRISKWEKALNKSEIILIEYFLKNYMQKWNYKQKYSPNSARNLLFSLNILDILGSPPVGYKDLIKPYYKLLKYIVKSVYYAAYSIWHVFRK